MTIDQDPNTPLTDEDRFHDIVDGRRLVKILDVRDILLLNRLLFHLGGFNQAGKLGRLFFGLSYDLGLSDNTQRMPDLSFVSHERYPAGKRLPSDDPWRMTPDLVADIITPDTSIGQNRRKLGEYRRAGVRLAWLIFPEDERVTVFRPDSSESVDSKHGSLDGGDVLPGFRMTLASLFDEDAGRV